MIEKLPGVNIYDGFAYDTALLHYFVSVDKGRPTQNGSHNARSLRLSGGSLRGPARGASMRGSFRSRGGFTLKRAGSFSGGGGGGRGTFKTDNGSAGSNSRGGGGRKPSVPSAALLRSAGSR
jgi:hypothetical protein